MATEMELPADTKSPPYGITQIDDKPATSVKYERTEREGQDPTYTVTFKLDNKTVAKLKDLDADALRDAVGDKNADQITGDSRVSATLRGEALSNDYGLSPAENNRRVLEKENRKAAEYQSMQTDELRNDHPDEQNKVERVPEKELQKIDSADALARVELLRRREREHADRVAASTGSATQERVTGDKPSAADAGAEPAKSTAAAPELVDKRQRQSELLEQVHGQFRVSGVSYLFKDQPNKVAFKDKGERMVSSSNDDRVAKAMATMAEGKGWTTIKVSGHADFKREVWLEASTRGLAVRGYEPTEQDLKLLDSRRERTMHNAVERAPDAERKRQQTQERAAPSLSRDTGGREASAGRQNEARERASGPPAASAGLTQQSSPGVPLRSLEGVVIEQGEAPYKNTPGADKSYFVTVAGPAGSQTIWGKDLKRAMEQSNAGTGDHVKIDYKGNEPVQVKAPVFDAKGNIISREEIATHRNTWEVQAIAKGKAVSAVAESLIDARVTDPKQRDTLKQAIELRLQERQQAGRVPTVNVHDKEAPTRSTERERTAPQVERRPERTR